MARIGAAKDGGRGDEEGVAEDGWRGGASSDGRHLCSVIAYSQLHLRNRRRQGDRNEVELDPKP